MDDDKSPVIGGMPRDQTQQPVAVISPQAVVGQVQTSQVAAVPQPVTPTQAVGQAVASGVLPQAQPQIQPISGGLQKEHIMAPVVPERTPLVELSENEKIPAEVEGWMEKLEQAGEIKIPEVIKQDKQVILENAKPTMVQDTVVLPLSQSGAALAAKKTVSDSAKWLYVWCVRLFKILGERARWGKEGIQV